MKSKNEINSRRRELRRLLSDEEVTLLREKSKARYRKNREMVSAEGKSKYASDKGKFSAKNKASHERHREKRLAAMRARRERNRKELSEKQREYYRQNKVQIAVKKRDYERRRMKEDPKFRMSVRVRHRVRQAIKLQGGRKFFRFLKMSGCDSGKLIKWIEEQFKPGMTWENYGRVWHVDHKTPLSFFDLTDQEEQKKAAHFTNLQPLLAKENLWKSNKLIYFPRCA